MFSFENEEAKVSFHAGSLALGDFDKDFKRVGMSDGISWGVK